MDFDQISAYDWRDGTVPGFMQRLNASICNRYSPSLLPIAVHYAAFSLSRPARLWVKSAHSSPNCFISRFLPVGLRKEFIPVVEVKKWSNVAGHIGSG